MPEAPASCFRDIAIAICCLEPATGTEVSCVGSD